MFEIYMQMRRNGEINLRKDGGFPTKGLQAKIAVSLKTRNSGLRWGKGVTTIQTPFSDGAIDPPLSDIVPPGGAQRNLTSAICAVLMIPAAIDDRNRGQARSAGCPGCQCACKVRAMAGVA
jgi:hypothetical protein